MYACCADGYVLWSVFAGMCFEFCDLEEEEEMREKSDCSNSISCYLEALLLCTCTLRRASGVRYLTTCCVQPFLDFISPLIRRLFQHWPSGRAG